MLRWSPLALVALFGCKTAENPTPTDSTADPGTGYCAVQTMVAADCLVCHSTAAQLGDLDLQADLHGTLLSKSPKVGVPFVVPGDPDSSLLVLRLRGVAEYGDIMPPTGAVDAAVLSAVEQWIVDGADATCDETIPTGPTAYHPEGFAEAAAHGMEAKLQEDDCQSCHGEQLDGGQVGVSCQECHSKYTDDWVTDCTFCHGDPADGTGAPPQDIDDNADPKTISFPGHPVHLSSGTHADWGCDQCHVEPTDVFSPGHVFVDDATPGTAELDFSAGLSAGATGGGGTCSNVYCHGGQSRSYTDPPTTCISCHAGQATPGLWSSLSGPHRDHMQRSGVICAYCHSSSVDAAGATLLDPASHVDGSATVDIDTATTGITRTGERCTGWCHNEQHNDEPWR